MTTAVPARAAPPAPAAPRRPVTAPAASTVRFALLVAAVLATSSFMFLSVGLHLPGRADRLNARLAACNAALEADPGFRAADPARYEEGLVATARWRTCVRPVFLEQLGAVGTGVGVLFAVAVAGYLAHPAWLIRRRRLRPLPADTAPGLVRALDRLRVEMGLSRPPRWLLAPHHRTAGGQAFGLPGRRFVQVDAGLALRLVTDRPAFRAVVLHELAHLRNRDVDKTHLTIAVWRAFLAVAVLPYLVLIVHPELLRAPLEWHWRTAGPVAAPARTAYLLASLVALTGLVYLTRNAVLRVREAHADAVAAAHDGPDSALPAVLERLPAPPGGRWARWGTHPDPRARLAAVRDPRRLLTGGRWELAGVGLAAGTGAANLKLVLGLFAGFDPVLGVAIIGLVAGAAMAAMLAIVLWRNAAADPAAPPRPRSWLAAPAALTAGFLAGSFLALDTIAGRSSPSDGTPVASRLVSALVLLAGAVPLAAWAASAARGILAAPPADGRRAAAPVDGTGVALPVDGTGVALPVDGTGVALPADGTGVALPVDGTRAAPRRRWAMPAVVAAAAVAGAVGFAVWLPYSLTPFGFALRWGPPPALGAHIDWFARVAEVAGGNPGPAYRLVLNPFTLPAVTLLWLVPVLAVRRMGLRRAVLPALVGSACVAAVAVALPFAARAALPARVRRDPPEGAAGAPFYAVLDNVMIAVGSLAVAVVVAVVVARRGPHRPVLALCAATLTALLSTAAMIAVGVPAQCATNVWAMDPAPRNCLAAPAAAVVSSVLHWTAVQGLILAIPLAPLAAAAGARCRRHRSPGERPEPGGPTRYGLVPLGLAAAAIAWSAWAVLPAFVDTWLSSLVG